MFPEFADIIDRNCRLREISASQVGTTLGLITELVSPFHNLKSHNNSCVFLYLLTPWCRVFLEKLTGLQLVKKFPAFYGTRRFITATHKRPPPVPVLGQPNPVHIPTSHLLEIHPNIIHPSTPRSPHWSLSFRFPHQDQNPSPIIDVPLIPVQYVSACSARNRAGKWQQLCGQRSL